MPEKISYHLFTSAPKNMDDLTRLEVEEHGGSELSVIPGGIHFTGSLETIYRFCIGSRTANRLLAILAEVPAESPEGLRHGVEQFPWHEHFSPDTSFKVRAAIDGEGWARHTAYAAQVVKDGIMDAFSSCSGRKPLVDLENPEITVTLLLSGNRGVIGIDLSGESLHRRGYRGEAGKAPLKENVAAALLIRAGWPQTAESGGAFVDPFCGSGTLPIEAALMASDTAPGSLGRSFGFENWLPHDTELFRKIMNEFHGKRKPTVSAPIIGRDIDPRATEAAKRNCRAAGVDRIVRIETGDFRDIDPAGLPAGLIAANPPYGIRLDSGNAPEKLYREFGTLLKERFSGWRAAVIAGDKELSMAVGLKPDKVNTLYNGRIECTVSTFTLFPKETSPPGPRENRRFKGPDTPPGRELSDGTVMFMNRLKKNMKKFKPWVTREGISCYRVYDADMPEYSAAVDLYIGDDDILRVHMQEYAPPDSIAPESAAKRFRELKTGIEEYFKPLGAEIYIKVRERQKGRRQYVKQSDSDNSFIVKENGFRFYVNLDRYLDSGIFLDHRITRKMIGERARGKRFLNLFGYTGTATVYAAGGGAVSTLTIDTSSHYLEWAEKNLILNNLFNPDHQFLQEDCLQWLDTASKKSAHRKFDLIFLDPPTFSNSKDRERTLDIRKDHVDLIKKCISILSPEGELIFSNNFRKFKMDHEALAGLSINEISRETLPPDFERNPRIHNAWIISRSV